MHNCAFRQTGINAVYIACDVQDIAGAVTGLRALNIKGASITIPHKVSVMGYLDEVDETARRIGAVNTIACVKGRLVGSNTDCLGAVRALSGVTPLRNKHVVIIGAGGAARAVGFGLMDAGAEVVIVNRTPEKGENLARDLNADFIGLHDVKQIDGDILVNTTPVGMTPDSDRMPVAEHLLRKDLIVMDAIYNPLKTLLLRTAERRGCRTVSGLSMFVYQGAAQFERWTGTAAPLETMEAAVRLALGGV
jgi:shikimate dehydrogenase